MSEKIFFSEPTNEMLVVEFVWENENLPLQNLPASFTGKKLDSVFLPDKKIMVIGLGKKEEFNEDYYRRAAGKAVKTASYYKIDSVYFDLKDVTERNCTLIFEGASLANYAFDKYKSEESKFYKVKKIGFPTHAEKFKETLNNSALVCENAKFVRDLVNENSNIVNPDFLEKTAEKIAKENKLKISVLKKKRT